MRGVAALIVVVCLAPSRGRAQDTTPPKPADTNPPAVPRTDSVVPPTPAQERYIGGLRTASRGIAQLKDGLERVVRVHSVRDSLKQREAGRRLGGLCGAARGFMASGRAQMLPSAYDPPTRIAARQLAQLIDSLIAYAPTCERTARRKPGPVADRLTDLLKRYEGAVATWRVAVGLPNPLANQPPSH